MDIFDPLGRTLHSFRSKLQSCRIYVGELNRYQVAKEYDIGEQTARNYMKLYRDLNGLPAKRGSMLGLSVSKPLADPAGKEEFESMTKEELIMELMKARIAEARLKKVTR